MARMQKLKETDLYQPVKDYLEQQGYRVRGEVNGCDIAATKEEQLLVVELKLSLNTTLLVQAIERQRLTNLVYVALPKPSPREWRRRWTGLQRLLRRLELGLLLVSFTGDAGHVEVAFDPAPFQRRKSPQRLRAVLTEIAGRSGDFNLGGSSRRRLLTAYREQALYIAWWLSHLGPQSPKALRLRGTCDSTRDILYRNHYGWFEHPSKGFYQISEAGLQALEQHPELVACWQEQSEVVK
ncbi:MAG: DUF2161 family putative PD-(D/E)XK-type phosphodiesterase [Bacillota bacterium]|jgi:hypothetical protein